MLESVVVQCRISSTMMYGLPGQDNGEYAGISEEDDAVVELEGPARRLREAFEGSDVATAFRIWNPADKRYLDIDGEGGVEKFDT
ncbi:hypothetical protein NXS19_004789 [Fusarium pseudograminearum]|nr:hypothetical protein NXS19_004789 [Fusarium pseudograminearum]